MQAIKIIKNDPACVLCLSSVLPYPNFYCCFSTLCCVFISCFLCMLLVLLLKLRRKSYRRKDVTQHNWRHWNRNKMTRSSRQKDRRRLHARSIYSLVSWHTLYFDKKQLSAEVQYIIPTNNACRIVTHARYINRACLRKLILQLYTALTDCPHIPSGKLLRPYAIGRGFDPVVVL